jgi:23S rRNA (guanine745-N1)-methyltransferase
MHFCCPNCGGKLNISDKVALCERGHSFDRARGGYYNLLVGNTGGVHGDNKEMVLARRAFLGGGYYAPLANRLAELVATYTEKGGCLLDAGAGEGYYTDIVERALFERDGESDVSAFDISKDAVREISKKNPRISLAVAGSYHMPIADGEFDTVINTFSPLALEETRRVLKPGGIFIMAIPGEMHLYDLKQVIYDTPYKNIVADTALDGFELIEDEPLTYKFMLDSQEKIHNLFMMTPYAYRTRPSDRAKVEALSSLECTADFRIFVYRRI